MNTICNFKSIILILAVAFLLGGCAIGTTELDIAHNEINKVQNKRTGKLLIKQFIDSRKDTRYIGNKRNSFGMVLGHVGLHENDNLESILTSYFTEALEESGYQVTRFNELTNKKRQQENYDAIIEGDIREFWMDLYMAVWHKVKVDIKAIDPQNNAVLWENQISGNEKRVLWIGATGEFERVVREAITKTLNQAIGDFTGDEFHKAVITANIISKKERTSLHTKQEPANNIPTQQKREPAKNSISTRPMQEPSNNELAVPQWMQVRFTKPTN